VFKGYIFSPTVVGIDEYNVRLIEDLKRNILTVDK